MERGKFGFGGVEGRRGEKGKRGLGGRLTVRAYWRMSTSVMVYLFPRTGKARARENISIGAAVVESFMAEIWVVSRELVGIDNRGRAGRRSRDHQRLPCKTRYTSSNTPLHPSLQPSTEVLLAHGKLPSVALPYFMKV